MERYFVDNAAMLATSSGCAVRGCPGVVLAGTRTCDTCGTDIAITNVILCPPATLIVDQFVWTGKANT